MGYMDEDDPDYWEDRRRAKEDMREAMREERRYDRGGDDDEDVLEFFLIRGIILAFIVFAIVSVMYFAAGWLDAQFGWGLVEWMNSWLPPFLQKKG